MSIARILVLIACVLSSTASGAASNAPSLDEIVARHLEARGGVAALAAIQTLVYSGGVYQEGDYSSAGKAFMAFQAPYFRVVGNPEDSDFMEGYDGSAWEWYGEHGFVVRTVGAASGATRRGTHFRGPFFDWRGDGSTLQLLGSEPIDGQPAWRVSVTTRDGFTREYFIDQRSYLIVAQRTEAPIHAFGAKVRTEDRFSDYRRVAGVLFPFRGGETEIATGETLNSMTWGKIEANRVLPASWWSPPSFTRTPLQAFGEHLYFQRDDVQAMGWTYAEFRRANPGLETREMAEIMGYQLQKMGNYANAVALLEWNARDYPDAAGAAFQLARAYESAGDKAKAADGYRRVLRLEPGHPRATAALARLRG
jgi:hypothetical protein